MSNVRKTWIGHCESTTLKSASKIVVSADECDMFTVLGRSAGSTMIATCSSISVVGGYVKSTHLLVIS
jgi:hypothetical protein